VPARKVDSAVFGILDSLRTGLWFIPTLFLVGAIVLSRITLAIDRNADLSDFPVRFIGDIDTATAVLATISAELMTFTGLIFTVTVVALQLASSQFSPRVLSTFLRDRGTQVCLGIFVATFTYALLVLADVRTHPDEGPLIPTLSMSVAIGLALASIGAFIFYAHSISQHLRVARLVETVAKAGAEEILSTHDTHDTVRHGPWAAPGPPDAVILHEHRSGVLASLDMDDLVVEARKADCVLRLVPGIGDYVGTGYPLFEVYAYEGGRPDAVSHRHVEHHAAFRAERTMRQDTGFALRQLVDIAERALSPAINDPTTAVQAIDRVEELLRLIVTRPLHDGVHVDQDDVVRFVHLAPTWEGYVQLAFTEIRHYGNSSFQVQRRLRSMAERLLALAPLERQAVLQLQLTLLDFEIDSLFAVHDRAAARASDPAGMGVYDR
jgi:uncharacterized membrane protein